MSLMNCAFTVRWSDEKNKPHAKTYATESDAKRAKKYGKLDKDTWQETLSKGLSECLRVVKPGCVVAMKWSERDIKTTELLKILPQKPALGDKTGMTRWLFFVKGVEEICS